METLLGRFESRVNGGKIRLRGTLPGLRGCGTCAGPRVTLILVGAAHAAIRVIARQSVCVWRSPRLKVVELVAGSGVHIVSRRSILPCLGARSVFGQAAICSLGGSHAWVYNPVLIDVSLRVGAELQTNPRECAARE
jgi:hypothetical protein